MSRRQTQATQCYIIFFFVHSCVRTELSLILKLEQYATFDGWTIRSISHLSATQGDDNDSRFFFTANVKLNIVLLTANFYFLQSRHDEQSSVTTFKHFEQV